MRYFVVSGELSGDIHGGNLVGALQVIDRQGVFGGWGGSNMQRAGVSIFFDTTQNAQMGWTKIISSAFFWIKKTKECHQQIIDFQPDALILIDFSSFNLRLAVWARKQNIPVFYFIAPKLWAWNKKRVEIIKKNVEHLFVIFPFEVQFFEQLGYKEVTYLGNPLVDRLSAFSPQKEQVVGERKDSGKLIALLPGSRRQEIERCLPIMLRVSESMPECRFVVAGTRAVEVNLYQKLLERYPNVPIYFDETYDILNQAAIALVTSGTATLEVAWFNVPQIVVYKTDRLTYLIARLVLKLKFISLVNILSEKQVVPELIQHQFTTARLVSSVKELLNDKGKRQLQQSSYQHLRSELGEKGASMRIAQRIYHILTNKRK